MFLWQTTLAGQVLVPARLLRYLAPWSAQYSPTDRPPWNPLAYDSVGQFYPWRAFSARTLRSGIVPLWNPYEFSGAPFVANSQSAVFYPGNALNWVIDPKYAAGWTALLHLLLAATFMWLFVRGIGGSDAAGVFAGIAFAFSAWQVSWLELPTFLCTSCWLPLALLLTYRLAQRQRVRTAAGLGAVLGLTLLAGHLQIAFYVCLASTLLLLVLLAWASGTGWLRAGALFVGSLALAFMLAAPQLLPSLELSRRSHRAGPPTSAGYEAYTGYAVAPQSLVTLFQPDFFGNPSQPETPYVGRSRAGMPFNYAEGALYVGLPTLLLAGLAVSRGRRSPTTAFLGGLGLLALLMSLGTAVDAILYFHVPGFGQSGSPGRSLVLWAFGLAALAGLGLDVLARSDRALPRSAVLLTILLALVWVTLYAFASGSQPETDSAAKLPQQAAIFVLSALLLVGATSLSARRGWLAALLAVVLVADLFANGIAYNQTAPPSEVYPPTASTRLVARLAGHDRVAPINTDWSFAGPTAVLPPNGALALGLRDVQGYDSLFPGRYKSYMNRLAGPGADASPIQVGNMVFARNPYSPLLLAAGTRVVLSLTPLEMPHASPIFQDGIYVYTLDTAPGRASARADNGRPVKVAWLRDDPTWARLMVDATGPCTLRLADEIYPGWHALVDGSEVAISPSDDVFRQIRVPSGRHEVQFRYQPSGFQVGLYLMLVALAIASATAVSSTRRTDRGGRT